ncbi:MAG: hypothetical protein RL701_3276 [Pseudomonadota bacterium]
MLNVQSLTGTGSPNALGGGERPALFKHCSSCACGRRCQHVEYGS